MLVLAGKAGDFAEGQAHLTRLLENKAALSKFAELVEAQGGNPEIITRRDLLPLARHTDTVTASRSGFVVAVNAAQIGYGAMVLGAGREYKGQQIDLGAGLVMGCRIGDRVEEGQLLATLYTSDPAKISPAREAIAGAIVLGSAPVPKPPLVLGTVTRSGFSFT